MIGWLVSPAGAVSLREAEVNRFAVFEGGLDRFVIYLLSALRPAGLWGKAPVIDGPVHHHIFGFLCLDVNLRPCQFSQAMAV